MQLILSRIVSGIGALLWAACGPIAIFDIPLGVSAFFFGWVMLSVGTMAIPEEHDNWERDL